MSEKLPNYCPEAVRRLRDLLELICINGPGVCGLGLGGNANLLVHPGGDHLYASDPYITRGRQTGKKTQGSVSTARADEGTKRVVEKKRRTTEQKTNVK